MITMCTAIPKGVGILVDHRLMLTMRTERTKVLPSEGTGHARGLKENASSSVKKALNCQQLLAITTLNTIFTPLI